MPQKPAKYDPNSIKIAIFFQKKITKNHSAAGTQTPNCAKFGLN